jgi:hypothetical protein
MFRQFTRTSCAGLLLAIGGLAAVGSSAQADAIRFFNGQLTTGDAYGTQPYYHSAAANAIFPLTIACPTAACPANDVIAANEVFSAPGGLT